MTAPATRTRPLPQRELRRLAGIVPLVPSLFGPDERSVAERAQAWFSRSRGWRMAITWAAFAPAERTVTVTYEPIDDPGVRSAAVGVIRALIAKAEARR